MNRLGAANAPQMKWVLWAAIGVLCAASLVCAGTIDTEFLQQPWPKQRVRELEVGRYEVRWRERANRKDGIFAGVRFTAPLERQRVWDLSNDYTSIGTMTPGVTAVRMLEQTPTRQVIQIDVNVLWKTLQLTFEVEQEPPRAVRFRLVNRAIGEYRGLCLFEDAQEAASDGGTTSHTNVELATWLKPSRPVPTGLLLLVERMALLQGTKEFLYSCERHRL